MKRKIKRLWHDLYYMVSYPFGGVKFAKTCKEVIDQLELQDTDITLMNRFRNRLHRSICQTCQNYADISVQLKKSMKAQLALRAKPPQELKNFNEKLKMKFTLPMAAGSESESPQE